MVAERQIGIKKLTPKQERFVAAYAGNAADAARQAGYSGSNQALGVAGARLLKNAQIAEAIAAREKARTDSLIANREERQRFWTEIMRNKEEETTARLKASELLGKSEGDFPQRNELTGKDGRPLAVSLTFRMVGADGKPISIG